MKKTSIAIVYATKGGMGDVGKFVVKHALSQPTLYDTRIIALSDEAVEGTDIGYDVGVTDELLKSNMKQMLQSVEITKLDIKHPDTTQHIAEIFDGVDCVIACVGNRQPSMSRWITNGLESILTAMNNKGIKKIVALSSFGLGNDHTPLSIIKVVWGTMLSTILRDVYYDLVGMEEAVVASKLDYVLVRPVGLTPEMQITNTYHTLTGVNNNNTSNNTNNTTGSGGVDGDVEAHLEISKSDVALFMLKEATPHTSNFNNMKVTICGSEAKKI